MTPESSDSFAALQRQWDDSVHLTVERLPIVTQTYHVSGWVVDNDGERRAFNQNFQTETAATALTLAALANPGFQWDETATVELVS